MENKKFWKLDNSIEGNGSRLYIDGTISEESWWGDESTPQQLRQELQSVKGNAIEVVINSPGGDVWAGVAMYDALKELDAEVTVKVSGLAASIASIIAMAGDKIVMTPGSTMMIHKASMFAWGNSDDMAKAIDVLEAAEEGLVSIYADRTGQSKETIVEMMADETWMSAEKAVELGFADSVVKPETSLEDDSIENSFSGKLALVMKANKEAFANYLDKAKVANETEKEPDDNQAPEPNADASKADAPDAADEGEEADTGKELTPIEDKEMKPEDIAKNQVIEPKNQAQPNATPTPTVKDYLASRSSIEDFAHVLQDNAGKTFKEVKDAWRDILVTNGLSEDSADYFRLPDPLVTQIETTVKASGIYNLLSHTGLDVFRVDWDDADGELDTSRAGGHKKGDTKDEQILDFEKRVIRAQYIYKYLVLNKEDVRENRSTGALVRFVLAELPERVIREIERAVVIGDGRASNAKRKINSFRSIKADVQANNIFASTYTPAPGESHYDSIVKALDLIEAEGAVYIVHKKGYLTDIKLQKTENGGYVFVPGTNMNEVLEVDGAFKPKWFNNTTDPDFDAYLVVFSAYKTVGDNSIEAFTNFKLETNENEYLQEIYKGGALSGLKAAVGIAKAAAPSA